MKELIFYDIEIFSHDALIVFKNRNKEVVKYYHNNFEGILGFIQDKLLVGYNNYFYDDKILTAMISGWNNGQLKDLNDKLISGEKWDRVSPYIDSIDCFQQINPSMPGLKKIEGNMGKMILESAISFDIDRPLTDEEFKEVFDYCSYDVDTTIDVYNLREHSYFESKSKLLEMLNNDRAKKWNTTTISANLLLDRPLPKWSSLRIDDEMLELVPPDVKEMWLQGNSVGSKIKKKSVTINEFDNDIQFGWGGLHGSHRWLKKVENVKLLDVASMYPSIIINLNALGSATKRYEEMRNQRVEIKHKDKVLSDALKLVLNSVYGNLKNKYSMLNNPRASMTVCVYGQIALYELCKRLSSYTTIININTDGVAFTTDNDVYKQIWKEWEKDFNLTLEEENFDLFIQKDVNNYIAITNKSLKDEEGKIIAKDNIQVKGGDVNRYYKDNWFANNNTRIVDIAIVDYLVNGIDVIDTLMNNLDKPYLYQYVLQAGSTYKGTFDDTGKQYDKINRVFATKKKDYVLLQKKRQDDGLVRFADAPDKMYLWNDECDKLEDFQSIVDLNHYYQLINRKLDRWK